MDGLVDEREGGNVNVDILTVFIIVAVGHNIGNINWLNYYNFMFITISLDAEMKMPAIPDNSHPFLASWLM